MTSAADATQSEARDQQPRIAVRARLAIVLVGLPSGAALIVYFVAGLSLPLGLALSVVGTVIAARHTWRRLDPITQLILRRRAVVGLGIGAVATVAYDATRFGLVGLLGLKLQPWAALPYFGQLLSGQAPGTSVAWLIGFTYHVLNGVAFAGAYSILLGQRGVVAGVAWALGLEAAMLAFYPGWLDIRAVQEFATVSMAGHVVYGLVLGVGCERTLAKVGR
jgi:hypothetical protein